MKTAQKTMKILDICEDGLHILCIKDLTGKANPYKLYKQYWVPGKGSSRKLLASYADFMSVLAAIRSIYTSMAVLK